MSKTKTIKTIFLDIDGVFIGTKLGYNFPQPNPLVIDKFRKISTTNVKVTLCTAKAFFCVKKTIDTCELNAFHITDGGAVIYNPFSNEKHLSILDNDASISLITDLEENKLYTEVYTIDDYYIAEKDPDITDKHTEVLGKEPIISTNLVKSLKSEDIIKIMLITTDDKQKTIINSLGEKYQDKFSLSWGVHPSMLPMEVAWFTVKGINKKTAVETIMALENSSAENSLGVGDSTNDWEFMQLCDNVATLENGSSELKKLVNSRGKAGHISPSVEENGILNIFNYFKV